MAATGDAALRESRMRTVATGLSAARAAVGLSILLAPRLSSRVLGFPLDHDNATARFGGRLFGVRELAVAGYTLSQVQRSVIQPELYLANAAVDVGDLAVSTLTVLGGRGIGRAALGSGLLAAPFVAGWLWLRGSCQG
jgi:hypothetical protein